MTILSPVWIFCDFGNVGIFLDFIKGSLGNEVEDVGYLRLGIRKI